jgi:hypothetical protein
MCAALELAADDPEDLVTEMGVHRTAAGAGEQAPANHHEALQAVKAFGNHLEAGIGGQLEGLEVGHVRHRST